MITKHIVHYTDARDLSSVANQSVQLVVTSPPYPMIKMWDELFSQNNFEVQKALIANEGDLAFELMHQELDKVWAELYRVVDDGCFVCINIGDATRTIGDKFQLYSNHSRIISSFKKLGFDILPLILWKKTTNAPNKFMGSGMLPAGAYVTLEHEYILIFRKGGKRQFKTNTAKENRNESSFFWEERNKWFSDTWGLKGVSQKINDSQTRDRSATYPFELAYRLISMYSLQGETVLDPFLGTGTTSVAALATGRNSIGIEVDTMLEPIISSKILTCKDFVNQKTSERIKAHLDFVSDYVEKKGGTKHKSKNYSFPVVTSQEVGIKFHSIDSIEIDKETGAFDAIYSSLPTLGSS